MLAEESLGRDHERGPTLMREGRLAAASKARSRSLSFGRRTDRRSTLTWGRGTALSSWSYDWLPRPVSTPTRRTSMKQMNDPKVRGCYLPASIRAGNWVFESHTRSRATLLSVAVGCLPSGAGTRRTNRVMPYKSERSPLSRAKSCRNVLGVPPLWTAILFMHSRHLSNFGPKIREKSIPGL